MHQNFLLSEPARVHVSDPKTNLCNLYEAQNSGTGLHLILI
jgi:hypothetical protein